MVGHLVGPVLNTQIPDTGRRFSGVFFLFAQSSGDMVVVPSLPNMAVLLLFAFSLASASAQWVRVCFFHPTRMYRFAGAPPPFPRQRGLPGSYLSNPLQACALVDFLVRRPPSGARDVRVVGARTQVSVCDNSMAVNSSHRSLSTNNNPVVICAMTFSY